MGLHSIGRGRLNSMQNKFFYRTLYGAILSISILIPLRSYAEASLGSAAQVTVDLTGQAPGGGSGSPVYCPNAEILAFRSTAGDLVATDQHAGNDVFIRNTAGVISIQSITTSGLAANGDSTAPALSMIDTNGFYALAFQSDATNLSFLTDNNSSTDVFIRFPTLNVTEIVSKGIGNIAGNDDSTAPSIAYIPSLNKIRIAFTSNASNLVSGDTNGASDVFLAELTPPTSASYDAPSLVTIRRISVSQSGTQGNANSGDPKISANGQYVVFDSFANNLVPGITATLEQVYVYDIDAGTLKHVSKTPSGGAASGTSLLPVISYNGRYIAYLSDATDIVASEDGFPTGGIYYDMLKDTSTRVNTDKNGVQGNGTSQEIRLSTSGRFVTFADNADNLVPNDTNGLTDVFVKDMSNNQIVRVSQSVSVGETDGASDLTATGGTFNDLNASILFRSFATNVAVNDHPSGAGDLYKNSVKLDPPPLSKGTKLEVPPDITLKNKNIRIDMQKFTTQGVGPLPRGTSKLEYDIKIKPKSKSNPDRRTIIAKRNRTTAKNFKPGTYTVRYRAKVQSGSKTVSKTPYSPPITFKIG